MDALRRAVRRLNPAMIPPPGPSAARDASFSRPTVARTWLTAAVVDTLLQYALKVRRWLWAGWDVICDRYLLDARVDLVLRFPSEHRAIDLALDVAERLCPAPTSAYLLTLPHDEMCRRMALKREPFPDPPSLRDSRYDAYMAVAEAGRITTIDASQPISNIHNVVLQRALESFQ
jgi:thymidylate kinase